MEETILISGINGFLGSSLFLSLVNKYNIIGLERNLNNLHRLKNIDNSIVRLYCINNLDKVFVENKIDYIIHTATHHCKSYITYNEVFDTNVRLGIDLFDFANKNGIKGFINIDSILNKKTNLYSFTKSIFRDSLKFISQSNKTSVVNIKLDMMYGANSGDHNFIQSMINKLSNNVHSIDLTMGVQERSFLYINDIVNAISIILNKNEIFYNKNFSEFYLLHPRLNTIKEVMYVLKEITNSSTELRFGELPYRENEIMKTITGYSINKLLDWTPKYSLYSGLNETWSKIKQ